jgi:MtrB/PioB family decaheme-associated outer membrane protein
VNSRHVWSSTSSVAAIVRTVLLAAVAWPAVATAQDASDPEVKALILPTDWVQFGVEDHSQDSAKFGEYNGLGGAGAHAIGDFHYAGGSGYGISGGTLRYGLNGSDIGTTSGAVSASVSNQGTWSLAAGYDDLHHALTNSYQTPFQGTPGGNNFTLPGNFGVINTAFKPAGFATAPGSNDLTAVQLEDFHSESVHSDRRNTSVSAGYTINREWDLRFDFNHLDQGGAKLLGVAGDQVNSPAGSTYTWAGQTPLVLMNPTDYTTDTFKFATNWTGTRSFATLSYYGSIFSDQYNSVSWNNPFIKAPASVATGTASAFPTDSYGTLPSNMLNQLGLTGGSSLPWKTHVAGGLSLARSEQDDAFPATGNVGLTPLGLPATSLHGLVDIKHADLRFSNSAVRRLALALGVKFDERNNKTASNPYTFNTINESVVQTETSVNAPMSNRKTQLEASGDLRLSSRQHLSLSYEGNHTRRWCNNAAANDAQGSLNPAATGSWRSYLAATCAEVPDTKENKGTLKYRAQVTSNLSFNAGYSYASRKVDVSPSFYNPMQAVDNPAGSGAGAEGYEVVGFLAFFEASRHEQVFKAGTQWEPSEKISVSLNGRYTEDRYLDLVYGVQRADAASANLDTSYSINRHASVSAYATYQRSNRDLTNLYRVSAGTASATALGGPAGETWSNTLTESDTTLGLAGRLTELASGKLELTADLSYSSGETRYDTSPFAGTDLEGNTCTAAYYATCGALPGIKNSMVRLQLKGLYRFDKHSSLLLGYTFQRLGEGDYFYNAYQYGATPATLLPTNQQGPSYRIDAVFVAYRYAFQ